MAHPADREATPAVRAIEIRGLRRRIAIWRCLAAFPDRVVKQKDKLLVALDIEERRESAAPVNRLASETTPEALVDLFPIASKNARN